ncbi:uncharacterized protein BP01DRAFT_396111 [Aspergillus saccharolyticus JOP 1030-1]|uniref:Uncharacterized protein n=1 Tax=Aspergillus saccharolyticus JOP 1030-1 TaxID=1450539 RepID=A0A318YZS1_9EURO|nr:hypothetical protein BP01DRAFT_396111 [Aspergillus saccharolyticus JOP 1030-1]PYH40109.1 hypothetical protein BP01DRAFT_396111 [Aspergillus saccharolyticus JOP 1030-1]
MVFYPPIWAGELPSNPDTLPLCDFMLDEQYGRAPIDQSPAPFICNVTGKGSSPAEIIERADYLARALSRELGWEPDTGTSGRRLHLPRPVVKSAQAGADDEATVWAIIVHEEEATARHK